MICSPCDECRLPVGSSARIDRKSTRLNSSHSQISYAVFCLKKKNNTKCNVDAYLMVTAAPIRFTTPTSVGNDHISNPVTTNAQRLDSSLHPDHLSAIQPSSY